MEQATDTVLRHLQEQNGFLPLTDKSAPEEIYQTLGMSKKTFKKAIGALYKKGTVQLTPDGISLSLKS